MNCPLALRPMAEPSGSPACGWQGQEVGRAGVTILWAAVIPGYGAASAPWRAVRPCMQGKVCRAVPAVPDASAVVWQGCRGLCPLALAQGPGMLAAQRGMQRVVAGRLSAARCSAELHALTCPLRWSGACRRMPGAAAAARLDRGGQEGRSGCCSGSGRVRCSARLGLAPQGEPLWAGCWLGGRGPGELLARAQAAEGQWGSPMPSLPPGAVAGAAGSKAQDQARRFHGAHRPQVPAAVVPGECRAGAAQCRARRGAARSRQRMLGSGDADVAPEGWLSGGCCCRQPGWQGGGGGGGRPEAATQCCVSRDTPGKRPCSWSCGSLPGHWQGWGEPGAGLAGSSPLPGPGTGSASSRSGTSLISVNGVVCMGPKHSLGLSLLSERLSSAGHAQSSVPGSPGVSSSPCHSRAG